MHEVADLGERFGPDHRADRHRLGGVEDLARLEGREERVDLLLRRQLHALERVREDEAVHADHDRERELLGEPESLDVQVRGLLVGLGVELDPARVALRHRVRVVVPDVDRRADRAVGDRHDDRQAEARGVVERLDHEQQALARGRGVGAGAGRRGADGDRHGGELGLDVDVLARRQLAGPDEPGECLDDVGLGRDRIGRDDLGAAQGDGLSDGARALHLLKRHAALPPRGRAPRPQPRRSPPPPCAGSEHGSRS